jgi:hypothetical protein
VNQRTVTILDPVARNTMKELQGALRLNDLNGKTLGILWNSKPNGDILLHRIEEVLMERYKLAGAIWRKKPAADIAGTDLARELVLNADAVINGQGD